MAACPRVNLGVYICMCLDAERITQSVVKSHLETCQYSAEDMKRFTWEQYTLEETRSFQNKVIQTPPLTPKDIKG